MTPALIADDEPPLVRALQTQLATAWPDLRVVATARNGVEAAALIFQYTPDLAFLDIQMPGLTELEVAQGIEGPTPVVFVTADDKYTCVQTATTEHLIRTPIAELAAQLDPAQFVQVHRSTVVNLAHLAGTRRDEASRLFVRVRGHTAELPVSRAYVHLFKAM